MSMLCGAPIIECVYCVGCTRWVWGKCVYRAGHESRNWGLASAEEFEPVPRVCRHILAVYEPDLGSPQWAPPGGYRLDPAALILRKDSDRAPPYTVYLDRANADIVVSIRGLNLSKECDYALLLDDRLGQAPFDGGYVHHGLLKAAEWLFQVESRLLSDLAHANPTYSVTLAGHSLGAGVAALLAMVLIRSRTLDRKRIRCYAVAPPRCVSLNLAVRYADVINSVVLQDDFLPRTTTALEDVYRCLICLPCLLCVTCLKDTCTLDESRLKDPRRLYAPGRLYHIVERKPFRFGRFPPVVKTAVPVDARFEHIVLSCNVASDHSIIWIERESQRAHDLLVTKDRILEIPPKQKMERQESLVREHEEEYKAALQKAIELGIPHASASYGTFNDSEEGDHSSRSISLLSVKKWKESWDKFTDRLFDVNESGNVVFKAT